MSHFGNDCHFYYNSTCSRGDQCSFRHVEAAKESQVTCNFWKQNLCTKPDCAFRHAEIRSTNTIPCYWENQPGGCSKVDCLYLHTKPRPFKVLDADISDQTSGSFSALPVPVIPPIIVNTAEDSYSDMESPKKKPPDYAPMTSGEDTGGESSGQNVQSISVITGGKIQPVSPSINQPRNIKQFGPSRNSPWRKTPFQQHMHRQQMVQQKKKQFQQRQQHFQNQSQHPLPHQSQPHLQSNDSIHHKKQQQRQQQRNEMKRLSQDDSKNVSLAEKQDQTNTKRQYQTQISGIKSGTQSINQRVGIQDKRQLNSNERKTQPILSKKIIRTKKDNRKDEKPEPKKGPQEIKKIIKVVSTSDSDTGKDDLGIKSLEQTLRERALRSMGIVEILVKKKDIDEKETKSEEEEDDEEEKEEEVEEEEEEQTGSEQQEDSAQESEVDGEGSEEEEEIEGTEEEEGVEEEEEVEEETEEEDLQDPEEIEILPVDNAEEIVAGSGEEQEEGSAGEKEEEDEEEQGSDAEEEVSTPVEDTRKAVKTVRSPTKAKYQDKKRHSSKRRENRSVKSKSRSKQPENSVTENAPAKRHVLDRLGKKVKPGKSSQEKDSDTKKPGKIIKLRRSSKSLEELKLNSKNRIKPDRNDLPHSTIGSTNTGTVRLTGTVKGRLGNRDENLADSSRKNSGLNIKNRLGWNRPTASSSENSEYSDSEKYPKKMSSVKNRLGWNRDRDRSSESYDENQRAGKKTTRPDDSESNSNMKGRHGWTRRKDDDFSDELSDSNSENELRQSMKKLREKLEDFDSDTIEDILLAREMRRRRLKSRNKHRRKEETILSDDSDLNEDGNRRRAKVSKSSKRKRAHKRKKEKRYRDESDNSDTVTYVSDRFDRLPPSRPTGITFQVKNDMARRQADLKDFSEDSENSDIDKDNAVSSIVSKSVSSNIQNKRGWTKTVKNDDENDLNPSLNVAKKAKINRIQWGIDDKQVNIKASGSSDVKTVEHPSVVGRRNTSWSTRDPSNATLAARNEMQLKTRIDQLDQENEEKVNRIQIKSLDDLRKEKAVNYISDDSSAEELDPMEALRQRIHGKNVTESVRQTQKSADTRKRARQEQQIYVPPPRKRTVELAFDKEDVIASKKERISPVQEQFKKKDRISPVQDQFIKRDRLSPVDDMFDDKPQQTSKVSVKTFAEIMAEKRARAKQLREQQSSTSEKQSVPENKPKKLFTPVVFDIHDGSSSKSVSPMNRVTNTGKISPTPASVAVDDAVDVEEIKVHKSHKHHHKSKSEKSRKWRKKKTKSKLDEDETSQDATIDTTIGSGSATSSSVTTKPVELESPPTVVDDTTVSSAPAKIPPPVSRENLTSTEPAVCENDRQVSPVKKDKASDDWLNFDFGDDDLDIDKGDTKDEDELLREIDELLA